MIVIKAFKLTARQKGVDNKSFAFDNIKIREVKGKYYVYSIEKSDDSQRRDSYVGTLEKVVNFFMSGDVGVLPQGIPQRTRRDSNPGPRLRRPALCPG